MAITPRYNATQQIDYIRFTLDYTMRGVAQNIGAIPAGALILYPASGVHVTTAFTGTGTDLVSVGVSGTANLFMTALDVSTVGWKAANQNVAADLVAADTIIQATYTDANSDAGAGSAEVIIAFIPDNDK